jgi:hypothetical protein
MVAKDYKALSRDPYFRQLGAEQVRWHFEGRADLLAGKCLGQYTKVT